MSEAPARGPDARPEPGTCAIAVLAAGASRRMGGPHKLLRPYPDHPVVRVAAEAALAAGAGPVAVVADPAVPAVAGAVADLPLTVLPNPRAADGASTSVARAAAWAFERAEALILTLGDEPDVTPGVIMALVDAWRAGSVPAMRCRYRDRPGHPVLATRGFFDRCRLEGDAGLGAALAELGGHELEVDFDAPADLDTEADYRAALARLAH